MEKEIELYNKILDYGICQEETLQVVTSAFGYTIENMNIIVSVLTEYNNIEQYEQYVLNIESED